MDPRRLLVRTEARAKVLRGATALVDAVRVTLGPRSRSVLIAKKWGPPIVCTDGVSIAKELELPDVDEDLGVRTLRQAAERTRDAVGDGTSTSMVLAHAIYVAGVRNIEAGASASEIERGLERGAEAALAAIQHVSRIVAGERDTIVPGCGLALLRAIEPVKLEQQRAAGDERIGLKILTRALEAPTQTIAGNSGHDPDVVVERMRAGSGNHGFDAVRGVYCDLVEAGIIDPHQVVRMALENGVSVARGMLRAD